MIRWDPATDTSATTRLGDLPVTKVAISDDGAVAAATDGRHAVIWHPGTAPIPLQDEQPGRLAVSPKGTTVAVLTVPTPSVHARLSTFDASTGARRRSVGLANQYGDGVGIPNEQTVAVTSGSGRWQRLRIADLTVTVRQEEQSAPPSRGISATSDDGSFTGFLAGWATVFDTASNRTDPSGYSAVDSSYTPDVLAIRRDGKWVASGGGGQLWVSEVSKGLNGNRRERESCWAPVVPSTWRS
ncbi:hypothetical protein SRB17_27140 [Streptomyces sp. RB17]|uniref:hypothetical protein n=1 Tax=Streptomyces sp. RB17 TaxID=2585197 RepID=UPI00129536A2|nr:hypothetical protein [Streptomyces sp. RB17]MQY34744.1 hypothetical protein [Streptomyces sp. RB17]